MHIAIITIHTQLRITILNKVLAARVFIKNTCYSYVINYIRVKLLPSYSYSLLPIGYACLEFSSALS